MTDLPDINVWVALTDAGHRHHARATRYWESESAVNMAFCRITMLGFLRLLCQPKVMLDRVLTVTQAWNAYHSWLDRGVTYLEEPASLEAYLVTFASRSEFIGKQWTDAFLASFAVAANLRLVSFDADFHQFPGLNFLHLT